MTDINLNRDDQVSFLFSLTDLFHFVSLPLYLPSALCLCHLPSHSTCSMCCYAICWFWLELAVDSGAEWVETGIISQISPVSSDITALSGGVITRAGPTAQFHIGVQSQLCTTHLTTASVCLFHWNTGIFRVLYELKQELPGFDDSK